MPDTDKKIITHEELTLNALPVLANLGCIDAGKHLLKCYDAEIQSKAVISDLAFEFSKLGTIQMAVFGGWCVYAGIGCVRLLRDDKKTFAEKSVVTVLSEPHGFEHMDEYVTDIIGIGFGTSASDELIGNICTISEIVLDPLAKLDTETDDLLFPQMHECFEAMYLIGVSLGVSLLGAF